MEKVTGRLTAVDCSGDGVRLWVEIEGQSVRFAASDPKGISFISFSAQTSDSIACGETSRPLLVRVARQGARRWVSALGLGAPVDWPGGGGRMGHAELERERTRELARIGSNLNQIARWANTHKENAETVEMVAHLVAIERALETLAAGGERR